MQLTDSTSAKIGASVVRVIAVATAVVRQFFVYTDLTLTTALLGAISLIKNGSGILTVSGANTYSGTTSINAGTLSITATSALPGYNTNGRFAVAPSATLAVYNAVTDAEVLAMRGTSNFQALARLGFDTSSGNRTYTPSISNTSQGALGLVKLGSNTLTLGGVNTYTGPTIVLEGTVATNATNILPDSSAVTVASGATLALGGSDTISSVDGAGIVAMGANNLTLSGSGITDFSGAITNTTGKLTKIGTGSQTLSGTSSITQDLTHTGGTLVFSGNFTNSKDFELCRGTSASPANCTIAGVLTQTGFGSQGTPRCFSVAQNGNNSGTLTIAPTSNVTLYGGFMIGDNRSTGSVGSIIINGGIVDTGLNGAVFLSGPSATLTINDGQSAITQMWLSGGHATDNPTPSHIFTINGGTINIRGTWNGSIFLQNQASIIFGTSTTGVTSNETLNLNGGTLKLNNVTCNAGSNPGGNTVTINFNGGIFDYDKGFNGRSLPNNLPARTTWNLVVKNGGARISVFSGATLTMIAAFSNDGSNGGLTKIGTGTLALGSLNHSYNGTTSILAGTLTASKTSGSSTGTATFTNTTLSVSFNVAPTAGMTFRYFPGATTQTYASVTLVGAPGRTGTYNSANSTLTIA